MGKTVKVRRVFPGSNSAYGFFSFFDQITGPQANRIFVIKGGPGVGKSTFMNAVGKEMQERGFDVEYHHCASDNESLDGLVIPAIGIAFMDGTAPHIVDPRHPGAVDEIIHLGSFWNEAGMRGNKVPVIKLSAEIGRLFKQVYRFLAAAKIYLEALESYDNLEGITDQGSWDRLVLELIGEILTGTSVGKEPGRVRRLFASAISPGGPVNFLDTLVEGLDNVCIIHGQNGTAKGKVIARVADAALLRGYYIEAYHCAFDPHRVDHILIPELRVAIINSMEPHYFSRPEAWREIDTGAFAAELPRAWQEEKQAFKRSYQNALSEAVSFLTKAKSAHDELESLYIPNMNFAEIDLLRQKTLERILDYARIAG
ncbi:MAG: hypothetical protein C4554_09595 [Dethiobacter sp.]|nr:MAG: hypothetical protein C4554_09595 [Dethiobacter sp.]